MKQLVPTYYRDFHCIADRCQHSCCIGWEIDIDEETAAFYDTVGGPIGERLANDTATVDGVRTFCLKEGERCPFLNKSGLCDLICALGEDALCQICADHPRFRNVFTDRVETGLGLCCEEAARILLTSEDDTLITIEDDGVDDPLFEDEAALLQTRERLFAIARNDSQTILAREEALLRLAKRAPLSGQELYALFEPLERLEDDWSDRLTALLSAPDREPPSTLTTAFSRLLVYFLFRHLPDALDDDRLDERIAFAAHSVKVLRLLCAADGETIDVLAELSRRFSAEIEYSDENIDTLLDAF